MPAEPKPFTDPADSSNSALLDDYGDSFELSVISMDDSEEANQEKPLIQEDEESLAPPPVSTAIRENLAILLAVAINTIATCLLVLLNKFIFSVSRLQSLQFSFTAWHVFCTVAILLVASRSPLRLFERTYLSVRQALPLAVAFVAWIYLNNLSLQLNPLGFYQIAKIATTPTVVLLGYMLTGVTVSRTVFGALVAICAGAALTCHGSTRTTALGAAVAVVAFVTTAVYQIWIGKQQADTGYSGVQVLFNQSYLALGMLTVLVPFLESRQLNEASGGGNRGGATAPLNAKVWIAIALSGAMAMVVNLTQFMIIGRTSAMTACPSLLPPAFPPC